MCRRLRARPGLHTRTEPRPGSSGTGTIANAYRDTGPRALRRIC